MYFKARAQRKSAYLSTSMSLVQSLVRAELYRFQVIQFLRTEGVEYLQNTSVMWFSLTNSRSLTNINDIIFILYTE